MFLLLKIVTNPVTTSALKEKLLNDIILFDIMWEIIPNL